MTDDHSDKQKQVEFYAAAVNAWFNTALEHDKSLLTLSAGGIGLLITLLTTVGLSSSEALILYLGAISCFLVSLVAVLVIFKRNGSHIQEVLSGQRNEVDPALARVDAVAQWAFGLGALFTAVIGLAAAIHSYVSKDQKMSSDSIQNTSSTRFTESFNGAIRMQPGNNLEKKSFNGMGTLKPHPAQESISPAPITQSSTTPSGSAPANGSAIEGKQ